MNTISYSKEISQLKRTLGWFLMGVGIFMLFDLSMIFGTIFTLIGSNLLSTEGTEINLENKTYRSFKSIFGKKFGKWEKCPEFEYVSVFKTNENQTVRVITAETKFQTEIIFVNLFYNRNKHLTFYKTQDKNNAFKVAEKLKSIFNIDILDATKNEKKWL